MSSRILTFGAVVVGLAACNDDGGFDRIAGELNVGCAPVCDFGPRAVGDAHIVYLDLGASRADIRIAGLQIDNEVGDYFMSIRDFKESGGELPDDVFDPTAGKQALVAVGDTFAYPLIFAPPDDGFYSARVVINSDARNDQEEVVVRSQSAEPTLAIYPPNLDFGVVDVGDVGIATITIDNDGKLPAVLTYRVQDEALFGSPEANPLRVEAGDRYQFQVEYEPLNDAARAGSDFILFSVGDSPVQRVNLRANDCENGVPDAYDVDGDGYTVCAGDCDDSDPTVNPAGTETPNGNANAPDGLDNDCNDKVDDNTTAYDDDGDGYCEDLVECAQPGVLPGDCRDGDARVNPSEANSEDGCPSNDPICQDGIDNDCDGLVDGGSADLDGDGYAGDEDCEPTDGNVFPGAREIPNLKDDNCNGVKDEGTKLYDDDGDGYCEGLTSADTTIPAYIGVCANLQWEDVGDCDDSTVPVWVPALNQSIVTGDRVFPGADETLIRGVDNNCNVAIDEGTDWADDDGDGFTEEAGDCDDTPGTGAARNPGRYDIPGDGIDQDCNPNTGP